MPWGNSTCAKPSRSMTGWVKMSSLRSMGSAERAYLLIVDEKSYDSKAILGVAYRFATARPLGAEEFSGGAQGAAAVLRSLGFEVRNVRDRPPSAES
jgi:hypothetical protein